MTNKILCVHQGSELYGSDRVFIQSVKAFRSLYPQAHITVHVPQKGLLVEEIRNYANTIVIDEIFVLRLSRLHFHYWRNLLRLPACFKKAWKNIQANDLIYISTAMIWGYILLLRFSRKKSVIHVHEYGNGLTNFILGMVLKFSKAKIVVNSQATNKAYGEKSAAIIWNGVVEQEIQKQDLVAKPLRLLLLGRINSWKGHLLTIEALHLLADDGFKDIHLDIVGDVFDNQKHYYDELIDKIKEYDLTDQVTFHGFKTDPTTFFQKSHCVLVPSIKPEPFGLVAIEAMRAGLPVIAANHGGLKEIVVQNETGILFQANNAKALAEAIRKYIVHATLLNKHGQAGNLRYHELFTEYHYIQRFTQAIHDHVE